MSAKDIATVTWGMWSVSVTTGTDIKGAVLSAKRHYYPGGFNGRGAKRFIMAGGDLDGQTFPTDAAAWEAAMARGYVQPWFRPRSQSQIESGKRYAATKGF